MLLSAGDTPLPSQPDLVFVYSLPALTSGAPQLLWRFGPLTVFWAPESWSRSKNPADEERFSTRDEDRSRRRARQLPERERKRDATFTTSATATRTGQAA